MAFFVQLRFISAANLPRTDTFSKIDPYFAFSVGSETFRTAQRDDDENPKWNQDFYFECAAHNGLPRIDAKLELFDQDTFKDSNIGSAHLDTAQIPPSQYSCIELPITCYKEKYQKQGRFSTVRVAIMGWVWNYSTLRATYQRVPGAQFNDTERRLYVPFPNNPALYLGVEYDAHGVDCKVFNVQPNSEFFVDMVYTGGTAAGAESITKIRRRTHKHGKTIWSGITAFEEIKIDDIPLSADFNQLVIWVSRKHLMMSTNLDKVVKEHGWKGMLDFEGATKALHGVDFDKHEKEIYIPVESPPTETVLLVDYDKDDCDIKLAVLDSPAAVNLGYDLTIDKQDCKRTSQVFVPARAKLQGKYPVSRLLELDDVEYGTSFSDMKVYKYQLSDIICHPILSLVPLR